MVQHLGCHALLLSHPGPVNVPVVVVPAANAADGAAVPAGAGAIPPVGVAPPPYAGPVDGAPPADGVPPPPYVGPVSVAPVVVFTGWRLSLAT